MRGLALAWQQHTGASPAGSFAVEPYLHHGRQLLAGRVAGVGVGVFLIFFFLALSLALCLIGSRTKYRWSIYVASAAMFGIVAIILITSPKGEKPTKPPEGYDRTVIPLVIIMALMGLGVLMAGLSLLALFVLPAVYARPLSYHSDIMGRKN